MRWKELSSKVSKCLQSARGPDGISAGSLTIAGFLAAAGLFVNDLPDCVGDFGDADDTTSSFIAESVDNLFCCS